MNPVIPLGAVALALAGFMFWKKGNETAPRTFPRTPVIIPPIDHGDEGGDWWIDNYVPPAPGYDYGPMIEPWTKADDRRFERRFDSLNGFQTMEMWNIDPDAVDPHIGKPGYLGNNMWDLLDRSPVPVQGAIDPHIGKPGYLGNGMWDMLYRGTGASEQAYWSGYGEG